MSTRGAARILGIIVVGLLLRARPAIPQPAPAVVRSGDSTVVAAVRAGLAATYAAARPAVGLLTGANPLGLPGALGSEVQGFEEAGRLTRITAAVWTTIGKYQVEYFGAPSDDLRFVFETYSYRDEAPAHPAGRNFLGQPGWERRLYFDGGRLAFSETIGDGAPPALAAEVHVARAAALRQLLAAARARRR